MIGDKENAKPAGVITRLLCAVSLDRETIIHFHIAYLYVSVALCRTTLKAQNSYIFKRKKNLFVSFDVRFAVSSNVYI